MTKPIATIAAVAMTALGLGFLWLVVLPSDDGDVGSQAVGSPDVLLSTKVGWESVALRLTDASDRCVDIAFRTGPNEDASSPACLAGQRIAIKATLRSGMTVVYGITATGTRFSSTVEEGASDDLYQTRVRHGAAFVLIIDRLNASGTVFALNDEGSSIAEAKFDHGGPDRAPKGVIGSTEMLFTFLRDGAVWAALGDGTTVRLSDGTASSPDGYPFAAPDGQTVLYTISNSKGIFDTPVMLDAQSGSTRELDFWLSAYSNDGRYVAGVIPVDDFPTDRQVIVVKMSDLTEVARINVPAVQVGEGDTLGIAVWDTDNRLVATSESRLLLLSPFAQPPVVTPLRNSDSGASWLLAKPVEPGVFPAVRRVGSATDWGVMRIHGDSATFERRRALPTRTSQASLNPNKLRFLQALSGAVELGADGRVTRSIGTSAPAYLIGDGRNLFQLSGGTLTFLFVNVEFASAP